MYATLPIYGTRCVCRYFKGVFPKANYGYNDYCYYIVIFGGCMAASTLCILSVVS